MHAQLSIDTAVADTPLLHEEAVGTHTITERHTSRLQHKIKAIDTKPAAATRRRMEDQKPATIRNTAQTPPSTCIPIHRSRRTRAARERRAPTHTAATVTRARSVTLSRCSSHLVLPALFAPPPASTTAQAFSNILDAVPLMCRRCSPRGLTELGMAAMPDGELPSFVSSALGCISLDWGRKRTGLAQRMLCVASG